MTGWVKMALELGPLIVFFVVFTLLSPAGPTADDLYAGAIFDAIAAAPAPEYVSAALHAHAEMFAEKIRLEAEIDALIWATVAFMGSLIFSLVVTYMIDRTISNVAIFTAFIVLVTGALTIYLRSGVFIKMKPTIVYAFFAIMLFYGMARGKSYLRELFSEMVQVTHEGWMKLARNWALFFVFCALLNEFIWRVYSTKIWVETKTFVYVPLIVIFAALQWPVITRYAVRRSPDGRPQPSANAPS